MATAMKKYLMLNDNWAVQTGSKEVGKGFGQHKQCKVERLIFCND